MDDAAPRAFPHQSGPLVRKIPRNLRRTALP